MFHVEHSGETHRRMEQVTIPPSRPSGLDLSQTSGAGSIGREEGGADGSPPDPSSCSTRNTQTKLRNGGSRRPIRQAIRMFHVEHQTFPAAGTQLVLHALLHPPPDGAFCPGDEKASVLSPGKGQRRSQPPARYSRFECSTWNIRMKMRSKACGNFDFNPGCTSCVLYSNPSLQLHASSKYAAFGHWSPTIQWDV